MLPLPTYSQTSGATNDRDYAAPTTTAKHCKCASVITVLIAALTTQPIPNTKINTSKLKAMSLQYETSSVSSRHSIDNVSFKSTIQKL